MMVLAAGKSLAAKRQQAAWDTFVVMRDGELR